MDTAFEKARAAYGTGAYDDATLEFLFPKLKDSEDERIRKELKEAFESYDIESKWNGIPIRSIFAWLEKQKEQKPAEWAELQSEFKNINEAFEDGKKEVVAHPERYGLCKPAEWSEEDEKMLKNILWVLESYVSKDESAASPSLTVSYPTYYKEIDWLKSLRPQPKWKPSEEQMEALESAVKLYKDTH